ncbi:hypothetical protein, partial [Escherichia coli]
MLPSETMIWQPEFTDKTLSRKPGAVQLENKLDRCDSVRYSLSIGGAIMLDFSRQACPENSGMYELSRSQPSSSRNSLVRLSKYFCPVNSSNSVDGTQGLGKSKSSETHNLFRIINLTLLNRFFLGNADK